jgi:hypothetical protein
LRESAGAAQGLTGGLHPHIAPASGSATIGAPPDGTESGEGW